MDHVHAAGLAPLFAMWAAMMVGMMIPPVEAGGIEQTERGRKNLASAPTYPHPRGFVQPPIPPCPAESVPAVQILPLDGNETAGSRLMAVQHGCLCFTGHY